MRKFHFSVINMTMLAVLLLGAGIASAQTTQSTATPPTDNVQTPAAPVNPISPVPATSATMPTAPTTQPPSPTPPPQPVPNMPPPNQPSQSGGPEMPGSSGPAMPGNQGRFPQGDRGGNFNMMPPEGGQNFQGGPGGDFNNSQGGPSQEEMEKRQQQNDERMLKQAKRGLTLMERNIASMEKRIASIEKRGGVASENLKSAIAQAKDLIAKAENATTMDEFQAAGLEDMADLMQTFNDEMQKAEMSTQFPKMIKQANRMLAQQQKALQKAQSKASTLKINVDSLIAKWQKSVDDMAQAITQAQQSFQTGNMENAVDTLNENVFNAMQDLGSNQQVFEMIANSQRMFKQADKEIASIERKIANLKKRGEDTSDVESAFEDAKAKLETVKQTISQPDVDADTLISTIEDVQDAKDNLYNALSDLTGQRFGPQNQGIPGLNFQQFQAPPGLQQYFNKPPQESPQGGFQRGPGGSGNFQQPGGFQGEQPGNNFQQPGNMQGGPGPQGFNNKPNNNSANYSASALEAIQKAVDRIRAQIQDLKQQSQ